MKFSLGWLRDHLDTQASLVDITTVLDRIGLEVEGIEDLGETLAPFRTAKVLEAKPHPDADRLRVCKVEHAGGVETVVCGAPNAKAGMVGVFAPSGSTIPANGLVLKPTKIRGVPSNGMLVSEREMGLSDAHEGIIELDPATPVGLPLVEAMGLDDPVVDIAVTPNRPDALGVRGIARDLAAAEIGTLLPFEDPPVPGGYPNPRAIALEFHGEPACIAFAGRTIRGVANGASPDWMQKRLRAVGLRPINALADITNYVMIDRNRPLHAYDADRLTGAIGARMGRAGEHFDALNGHAYEVGEADCVIADEAGVLGLGGIVGGTTTGCTAATTTVFLESALFDRSRIARTGRRLGLNTDARYRFERGIDPEFTVPGLELATRLVLEICGGEASEVTVAGTVPEEARIVHLPAGEVKRLTGLELPPSLAKIILDRLGFWASGRGDLTVAIPSWRPDIGGVADLVEEIARIHGIDEVPSVPLPRRPDVARSVLTPEQNRDRRARRALASRGLVEAVTWSFIPSDQATLFGGGAPDLKLANPISQDMSDMRPSLLPGLVTAAARNARLGEPDAALFELGQVFADDTPDGQCTHATGLRRAGATLAGRGRDWRDGGTVDAYDAKADAMAVLAELGVAVDGLSVTAGAPEWYHPGRSGTVRLGPKTVLAQFGALHPSTLDSLDADGPLVAFEIFLDAVPLPKRKATRARPTLDLASLQPVRRDFAFVVDRHVPALNIVRAAAKADQKLVMQVGVFDVFEGGSLGADAKSVAIEVTLQPRAATLTEAEIEKVSSAIVANVTKVTGAALRS